MSTPHPTPATAPGKRRLPPWPFIIVGLLVAHTTLIIGAATLAIGDPSFAVVPDYYAKALAWDDDQASQRDAAERGWTFHVIPGAFTDPTGQRLIVATLNDKHGQPVPGAAVTLQLYHHARAADVTRLALRETAPGHHEALAPMPTAGTWRLEARVVEGNQPFAFTRDIEIPAATPQ